MTDLLLKRGGRRGEESYDVIADGQVVGRIMMFADTPAGRPWMWSLVYGHDEDRTPTHGYEATRETAMQAFIRSWNRDRPDALMKALAAAMISVPNLAGRSHRHAQGLRWLGDLVQETLRPLAQHGRGGPG